MEQEQIQQFIDNKTPVFIDRSYYFYDKPTIILEFCGNPEFVKVEGSTDAYETYRLRPAIIPTRITRSRKQKQVSPNGLPVIYVGRPTKWGNPFKVTGQDGHWFVMNEDEHPLVNFEKKEDAITCCVENYKEYITHEHNLGIKNISDLIGKNLSCWCAKDCLCHADVLLELAANIDKRKVISNRISIDYFPNERFGLDCININIKNTSFGALRTLQKDVQKLSVEWRKSSDECWHPVTSAYADLLEKLSANLKNKIAE